MRYAVNCTLLRKSAHPESRRVRRKDGPCEMGAFVVRSPVTTTRRVHVCALSALLVIYPAVGLRCEDDTQLRTLQGLMKCSAPTHCIEGACIGSLSLHLYRKADYSLVQSLLLSERHANTNVLARVHDTRTNLMSVLTDARKFKPTAGLHLGTTRLTRRVCNNTDDCLCLEWYYMRRCILERLASFGDKLREESPYLTLSADLSEYIAAANLEQPALLPSYFIDWGRTFIDAGMRVLLFSRVLRVAGNPEGTLSWNGRHALSAIMSYLEQYASHKGHRAISFLINLGHFDWYVVNQHSILTGDRSMWQLHIFS